MKIEWKGCLRLGVTCFLLYLCIYYWSSVAGFAAALLQAAGALIVGCVIAYLVNILMSFYERHYFPQGGAGVRKSRRPVCLLAALLTLLGVVVLVVRLVVPELAGCVRLLMEEIPAAVEWVVDWVRGSGLLTSDAAADLFASLEAVDWQDKISQMVRLLLEGVGGAAQVAVSTVSSIVSVVARFVIGFIFAVYLLVGKERLGSQCSRLARRYLPGRWVEKLRYVLTTLDSCFHRFIVGQCTEAVILGLLCMAGMALLRLPYAVMIGTLVGFTALIPIAGAYIGAAVGAFMILTVDPLKALIFLIFLVILQQLEGNLIYPKVVGTSIGLPGVWVLATVTVGGGVMGIGGMLLGVPLAAAVYQMLRRDVQKGEERQA
ncbi:MAG: AI-2E family transporter [Oscillospiraceae bacterium]